MIVAIPGILPGVKVSGGRISWDENIRPCPYRVAMQCITCPGYY